MLPPNLSKKTKGHLSPRSETYTNLHLPERPYFSKHTTFKMEEQIRHVLYLSSILVTFANKFHYLR